MKEQIGDGLFPNWIGPQRFGASRPVTPVVGSYVIRDDWKSAVMTYLSMEGDENNDVYQFRKHIRENGVTENK